MTILLNRKDLLIVLVGTKVKETDTNTDKIVDLRGLD